jgi:hypothetical protein
MSPPFGVIGTQKFPRYHKLAYLRKKGEDCQADFIDFNTVWVGRREEEGSGFGTRGEQTAGNLLPDFRV